MIDRTLRQTLCNEIGSGKAIMLIGPRQVGKTTLIKRESEDQSYRFFNYDDPTTRCLLEEPNLEQLRSL